MKIKKALLKDTFKEIIKTYKRFISIMLMALLGVGFFAGLRATSPDMVKSIDTYYKNQNVYDIGIISAIGLTDNDIEMLKDIEDVKEVYGTYSKDGLVMINEKEIVTKILCFDDVNKPILMEGNMPENINECVVEKGFLEGTGKKIGDIIDVEPENIPISGMLGGIKTEYLKNKTLKIVGVVKSPLYVSRERGSSKLGTGLINYYLYINKENINSKVYTDIYITLENSNQYETGSIEYEEYVQNIKNKIEKPEWYIYDRQQNAGYSSYIQDTKSVAQLSIVFPIVFFAIATLVSLTSMSRMVEEERQENGTLKALGYNKFHIMLKYLIYASLACIIGSVIGMKIGCSLLPRILWLMYEMMYILPEFIVVFNYKYSLIGLVLIYICIVGATLYTILKEVKEMPAVLLRPKAPKYGKRVLLERVTFIWKRLKFSQKVTVRNIFRYKKRFLMTIVGIMGGTALILTGFGIKDSISSILPSQYGDICKYDMLVNLKTNLTNEEKNNYVQKLKENNNIQEVIKTYMEAGKVRKR